MHTGFARRCIETSGKNILLATDMLDNAQLDQPVQARLHLLVQRSFVVQSINHKEILGGQQLCASFADPIENGKHRFVENQSVQRNADEEVICACEVGKRFCLLYTQLKHQVHALTGTLHHAAQRKDLRNTAVARKLAIQYVVERNAEGKSTGTFNNQSVAELADKDAAAKLIVSVAHRVQDRFSDNALIEGRNVKHEKAFLIVLLVVPQIDKLPHAVIASEKADLKLFSLIGRTRRFGGTVLENDLRLRQILDDRRVLAEQDQGCIRYAFIRDRAAVMEKLLF